MAVLETKARRSENTACLEKCILAISSPLYTYISSAFSRRIEELLTSIRGRGVVIGETSYNEVWTRKAKMVCAQHMYIVAHPCLHSLSLIKSMRGIPKAVFNFCLLLRPGMERIGGARLSLLSTRFFESALGVLLYKIEFSRMNTMLTVQLLSGCALSYSSLRVLLHWY